MSVLVDEQSRSEMLNRLKRAEGQLRGIQRMIESGQPGIDVASQLVAVRRALDSTYVHMTVSSSAAGWAATPEGASRSARCWAS
jgi:DNA-binding FrmR family transcriptional regulator